MKTLLFVFFAFLLGNNAFSQPVVKVYAFEQDVIPGNIPVVTDENGNAVKKDWIRKEYRIFLSFRNSYKIAPAKIFIKGKAFDIGSANTVSSPVQFTNIPDQKKITLVAKTSNKIVELEKGNEAAKKTYTATLKKLIDKNDVVIVYTWKGKNYYASVKELRKLEPQHNL
jgi:hypothetical protein